MAVASISAQSSIGMGAVINATFGSIIEIILYGIALTQGKGQLVEGSIVGSLLAGVLLMPGVSMISGAFRRKEQRFNGRSAGVTSTMLIMAIIGILTPTLFYEIYGTFKLTCTGCPDRTSPEDFSCQRCFYEHVDPVDDIFYKSSVQGLSYYCAAILALVSRAHMSEICTCRWLTACNSVLPDRSLVFPTHPCLANLAESAICCFASAKSGGKRSVRYSKRAASLNSSALRCAKQQEREWPVQYDAVKERTRWNSPHRGRGLRYSAN